MIMFFLGGCVGIAVTIITAFYISEGTRKRYVKRSKNEMDIHDAVRKGDDGGVY